MDLILNIFQFILLIELVYGRGSMLNPPQRSSIWRFRPWKKDKSIPKNLEDYGLNCGGFWRLHGVNKGKCGVCGDPYDAVSRQNEADGKYANGIIVRRYRKHQKFINVTIDITANIGGYFEFRICPNNNVSAVVTQECLDKHRLTVEGHGLKFIPRTDKKYKLALHMPKNLTCSQCVLQWKWRGSYNWGRCDDGYQDVGCGNQEEYYNCADIAILPRRRRRPRKNPKPPTKKTKKITKKVKPKVDKIQTIAPSKVVKTMSKDIHDIKSIDKIFSQQTNQVDPTGSGHAINPAAVSGIPVYMFKQETSTTLPPIDITLVPTKFPVIKQPPKIDVKPPKIFLGNKIEESNSILLEPVPVQNMPTIVRNDMKMPPSATDVKDNTIFDLASAKVMNGMRQDLVQSPGNNIFNKAEWITGTTAIPASGVGASGEGNASASLSANAITNASLTQVLNNTAFNSSAEQIGVLVATEETTLDHMTINRNVNMLSDMFYGAMLAGGETELDGLFPMSFFPTVTQAQPFGDLANQFMHSVIAMNAQRKANNTLQQGTFSNFSKSDTSVSNAQTRSTATVDRTDAGKFQSSSSTLPPNDVTTSSFSIKSNTASQLTSASKISDFSDSTSSSGTHIMETTRAAGNTVGKMTTSQITKTVPYFTKQTTMGKIVHPSNISSTDNGKSSSLYETSTIQSTPITQQVMNPISRTRDDTTISPPTTVNPWQEVLVQMNSLLNNLNSQLDTFVHGSNTQNNIQDGNESVIGSKPDQSNASTLTTKSGVQGIPTSWNVKPSLIGKSQSIQLFKPKAAFSKDGVVVSDVGGVPVHHPDQIFMDRPSNDIINQVDTSWRKLSQEPTTVFMNKILSNNINNDRQTTTETPFQKITPIVISDPKSKFSFKRLDARNVDVNDLPVSQRQVASNQHFVVSEPLLRAIESNKQTSSAIVDPIPKTRVSGINDIVIGQSLEQFTQDDALSAFKKSINDVGKMSKQSPLTKVDFWDAAQNILSVNNTRSQNSMTKTADIIGSPNSLQNPKANNVFDLAQTILSLNKKKSQDLMRPNPVPVNKPVRIKENVLNVWNTIIKPNPAQNKRSPPAVAPTADIQTLVNSFSNLMNNGIFVIPTTPKSLPDRRTRPASVNTGVTENILDVMSRIWNPNSLFPANTIG